MVKRPLTVSPPKAALDLLKHEVYTVGTSMRQVAAESGLDAGTVLNILKGNNVEQSTLARLEAYLKALSRNEFYPTRKEKHHEKGNLSRLDSRYWAYSMELWKVYKIGGIKLEAFQALETRKKLVWLNTRDYIAKRELMARHKNGIEKHRIWLPDAWSYFRWKNFLAEKLAKFGAS